MKRFLRFAALLSALALLGACDDDMYVTPLEVTNNNIAGTWQLAEWNGAPLAEGSFVYIEFIRKDAKYVMYQNLDSFGTRKLTGRFVIDNDAELGAVIRGSTTHYDYVCSEVSKGIANVSLNSDIPVMFGVITTENIEQAIERAGTKAGNKGYDCALGAIEMVNLIRNIEK